MRVIIVSSKQSIGRSYYMKAFMVDDEHELIDNINKYSYEPSIIYKCIDVQLPLLFYNNLGLIDWERLTHLQCDKRIAAAHRSLSSYNIVSDDLLEHADPLFRDPMQVEMILDEWD